WMGNGFRLLNDLDISGVKIEDVFAGILCRTTSLKKLSMEKCFIKPESNLEFIREQKDLKELRIGRNYLSEEHLDIIFNHENIKVLDMDSCAVDDMYVYGGKIESTEMLKVFNGRKIRIEDGEMRITLLETDNKCCLKDWRTYNERLMFFGNDGEIKVNLLTDKMDKTGSDALESVTKTWRLSELNGSQVFIVDNKEIRIVLPRNSSILKELKESIIGKVYFTGKKNGKMNFLDVMKSKGFIKNMKEYNCGQVYFGDKQIDLILSHNGLRKLNMRQCCLESKAIMKIKDRSILMELDLSDNNMIGEDDMIHIIKECPNLRKLNMSKCRMLVTRDFEGIPILEKLEELNIGENKLNSEYIEYTFKHKKLLRLNLEGCGLVEGNLKGIEDLEGLKELYINENFIYEESLSRIFKLKELEVLNMSNSRQFVGACKREVNIDGIKALSKLKVLDLSNNRLREKNINEIFELKELKELRMGFFLSSCSRLKNIYNLRNLEKFSTGGNIISVDDMKGVTSLKNLKELNISMNNNNDNIVCEENIFDNVGKLKDSLEILNIEKKTAISKKSMKNILKLTNLRELRFADDNTTFVMFCDILNRMPRLRALYLGKVEVNEVIDWERVPLGRISKLEKLKLECDCVSDEFIGGLNKLVCLKELSLICLKGRADQNVVRLDILVFPSGLRKLEVAGKSGCFLDLRCNNEKEGAVIFENMEDFSLFNIQDMAKEVMSAIMDLTRLRRLVIQMKALKSCECDLKGIFTLEELVLKKVDLKGKDTIELSCFNQLRRLELWMCELNEKYLDEIEDLKLLESLNIKGNLILKSMNGILKLRNLRKFSADNIRSDYDKQGDFELVKGFERLNCRKWEVYKNSTCIKHGDIGFDKVVAGIKKEVTLNNWKGVVELNAHDIEMYPVIFLAIFLN
ncbi:hypothetical protein PAEPH01_1837, partial [Pancytospora epiphaga]